MGSLDDQILTLLRGQPDHLSGEAIAAQLGVSRTAIWKHVSALRGLGYGIASVPNRGYRLVRVPDLPLPTEIIPRLRTARLGHAYHFLPVVDSTNRTAMHLADGGAPEGTTVVADSQTAGRGRFTRTWFSPPGANLYASIVLRPALEPFTAPQVAIVASVALARAVEQICPQLTVGIKWPNDVFLNGRKTAGVLCEMRAEADRIRHIVLGFGVNVNMPADAFPPEIAHAATSLAAQAGRPVGRVPLLAAIINELEPLYDRWRYDGLTCCRDAWNQRSVLSGRPVRVDTFAQAVEGTAQGLSETGGLLLALADGTTREVLSGDARIGSARIVGTPADGQHVPDTPPPVGGDTRPPAPENTTPAEDHDGLQPPATRDDVDAPA